MRVNVVITKECPIVLRTEISQHSIRFLILADMFELSLLTIRPDMVTLVLESSLVFVSPN